MSLFCLRDEATLSTLATTYTIGIEAMQYSMQSSAAEKKTNCYFLARNWAQKIKVDLRDELRRKSFSKIANTACEKRESLVFSMETTEKKDWKRESKSEIPNEQDGRKSVHEENASLSQMHQVQTLSMLKAVCRTLS